MPNPPPMAPPPQGGMPPPQGGMPPQGMIPQGIPQPQGISALQEKTFDYSSPESQRIMTDQIRMEAVKDPELDDEQRRTIAQMSNNQILEMVAAIHSEAQNQGTEEDEMEEEAESIMDNLLGEDELEIEEFPMFANQGGRVQGYNRGGLASMGRGGDSQLAHVMPGERMVPPGVIDNRMLDAAFVRAGLDPREYTVGSAQASTNPMTGMPEYGLGSFIKRLFKKVKKLAPAIGALVGFAYGGPKGAGIGKAIGGVIKTGDVDFQRALSDFGTGWALGNFATGMGMKGGQGMGSIFGDTTHVVSPTDTSASIAEKYGITEKAIAAANPNNPYPNPGDVLEIPRSMWGWEATDPSLTGDPNTIGGFIQSAGAKLAGGLGAPGDMPASLVDQFKNLPMAKKLGVGALGLAALKQTGMFDKEELGDTPPGMIAEMQGLQGYMNKPLTPANQVAYGTSPFSAAPVGVTQFAQMQPQQKSLTQILQDLREDNLRLPSPSFT